MVNDQKIAAGCNLEKFEWQVIQTAGVIKDKKSAETSGVYTNGWNYAVLNGRFLADELRALADYMDASKA